ncbi:copper chaperone PCu(A)C [Brytella acorum]|uniref:Copper chaperone PCu(A)C n=1 Tax=Brytella acorum TaxID=2959299 RepID=A0AA35UGU2_9PROT|nr:copper chaperone PCu(A)C [Brytella acorum]MDF3624399.1 copper chaperone PCu(A)C [Brytella acorum]CAI9119751.1 copper chaperone PCu(A)C [Brytella acorum]
MSAPAIGNRATAAAEADQNNAAADISVKGWMRYDTSNPDLGVGYFTITNNGMQNHLLTGVTSPACDQFIARHSDQESTDYTSGLFTRLALPRQSTMDFPEGGYHLVCLHTKSGLKTGDEVPVTFTFLGGSSKVVEFPIHAPSVELPAN